MQEILFRGKRKDNKEWVFGYYVYNKISGNHFIIDYKKSSIRRNAGSSVEISMGENQVIPETVGQYTDIDDAADNRLFKGDFIFDNSNSKNHLIEFYIGGFGYRTGNFNKHFEFLGELDPRKLIKIGNRWDNPELLKEK